MKRITILALLLIAVACHLPAQIAAPDAYSTDFEFSKDTLSIHHIKELEFIKEFYFNYMNAYDKGDVQYVLQEYVTTPFIDKQQRMSWVTDSDPFLRTKEFDLENSKSLSIHPLGGNWFLATYVINDSLREIPLRLLRWGHGFQIDYVTPEHDGTAYGDTLLFDVPEPVLMSNKNPVEFVRTFYQNYGRMYAGIYERPESELQRFRSNYCTPKMLEQYRTVERDYRRQGHQMFDVLISDFDFDRTQLRDLDFKDMGDNQVLLTIKGHEVNLHVVVSVAKYGNDYKIDEINLQ